VEQRRNGLCSVFPVDRRQGFDETYTGIFRDKMGHYPEYLVLDLMPVAIFWTLYWGGFTSGRYTQLS
jgi:hypothetical protein